MSPPRLGARSPSFSSSQPGVVAVGDEADVVAVGLVGDEQPASRGLLAHGRLGGVAEREQRVAQLLLVEHPEHVRLVLAVVDRPVHLDQPVLAGAQLRVVAGRDRVEPQPERPVEHGGELDLLVAPQARVGCPAGGVLVHEVLDHVVVEPLGEVPDVERDADHVGGPAGVVGVLDRAAAAGAGAVRRGVAREREVDAGDVVARLDRAGRGDGGVDAAGHGSDHPHARLLRAARARSTTGTIASTTASTSAGRRGVAEGEAQRVPRLDLVAPHREQHVGGLRHPRRAGRAGRALDALRVEQHQQRVALAVGEAEVGVAGQPPLPRRRAVQVGVGDDLDDPANQVVAQPGEPLGVLRLRLDGRLDGRGERRDARGVERAAADVALLAAAVPERGHGDLASDDQRSHAVRSPDLVAGERHRVDAGAGEVDRDRADRLHGVGVDRDAVGGGEGDHLVDRLQRADLVVGPHHRHQRHRVRVALDRRPQGVDVEPATLVDGQQLHPGALVLGEPVERVEHGVVLHRGREDPGAAGVGVAAGPVDALEGEVVGLGAAGGEHHLAGTAAQRLRDGLARLLDHPPRAPPARVQRAGVADVGEVGGHRLDGGRQHRRGGRVVEVDGATGWSGRAHVLSSLRRARGRPAPRIDSFRISARRPRRGWRGCPPAAAG